MARKWFAELLRMFGRNWITLFGASLTTVSGIAIISFLILGLLGLANSPYIALMALLVLPGVFVLGLLLIPVGAVWERRKHHKQGRLSPEEGPFPDIDLNRAPIRHLAVGVTVLTIVNLLIISTVSYQGVVYMDSSRFCGRVCHTVMQPEYSAYSRSPHSRVECVDCHIGPGAPWFVRSKLSGMGQVFAVTFNTYERPIPIPVTNLRPSRDTCEECHWPDKFTGDRIKVLTHYSDDEGNTPMKTVLLLHIGGGSDGSRGIHSWHIDPKRETRYIAADESRQKIVWVQVKNPDGTTTEYTADGVNLTPEQIAGAQKRTMDCIDCHNRPTHIFKLPGPALDEALSSGRVNSTIPFIKKVGVQVLTEVGQSMGAPEQVAQRLRTYYREKSPDFYNKHRGEMEDAVREIEDIYRHNVFPDMKLTWGTYPNNIGHQDFPGCFRCHDGEHSSKDDKTIEQDCATCHNLLAWDEQDPQVIKDLGIE